MNRYDSADEILDSNKRVYTTIIPPDIPKDSDDIYIITGDGDRFDLIAADYYGNSIDWDLIVAANSDTYSFNGSLMIPAGTQLRIPIDPIASRNLYGTYNEGR
jgi:hypothetical protein